MNAESNIETTLASASSRHRRGHIARLPKPLRDKVNAMLDDGAEYSVIVAELQKSTNPPLPHSVNEDNIGNWKKGGYQDYLRNRDYADALRDRQEKFLDATGEDPVKLADAGMQIAATGICELLDELSRPKSKDEISSDRYARISNSMSRLARVILSFAERRDQLAREKAAELPIRDPNKPFGDESDHRAVVDIIDRVLGLGDYSRPRSHKPTSTIEQPSEAPAESGSVNLSKSPCASVPDNGAPCEPDVRISEHNSSESESHTSAPQLQPTTATDNTQSSNSAPTTTNTIEWVPLEQRPCNWTDLPEFASMPSFPPASEANPHKDVGG